MQFKRVLAGMALALLFAVAPTWSVVQVGETAPDFLLEDPSGIHHSLSAYRGRVVLIAMIGYG